jgi:hypothetical protein
LIQKAEKEKKDEEDLNTNKPNKNKDTTKSKIHEDISQRNTRDIKREELNNIKKVKKDDNQIKAGIIKGNNLKDDDSGNLKMANIIKVNNLKGDGSRRGKKTK